MRDVDSWQIKSDSFARLSQMNAENFFLISPRIIILLQRCNNFWWIRMNLIAARSFPSFDTEQQMTIRVSCINFPEISGFLFLFILSLLWTLLRFLFYFDNKSVNVVILMWSRRGTRNCREAFRTHRMLFLIIPYDCRKIRLHMYFKCKIPFHFHSRSA